MATIAACSTAALIACSSSTTTVTDNNDSGTTTKDSGTSKDSGTTPTTDSGGGGDEACTAMSDTNACIDCCDTNHPTGAKTFINAVGDCACLGALTDAGADAGPACPDCANDLCKGQSPGQACQTCLQAALKQGGSCYQQVGEACTADKDCVADLTCANACP